MEQLRTTGSGTISRLQGGLLLIACLGLALSLAAWWRGRKELETVTKANEFLRETLGKMTIGIADKDRQIDQLINSPCATPEATPRAHSAEPLRQ